MKQIIKIMLVVSLLLIGLVNSGCANWVRENGNYGNSKPSISSEKVGKGGGYKVEFLFETKEGVKMYRFIDNAHTRYFAVKENSEVKTISTTSQKKGKQGVDYNDIGIQTVLN